MRICNKKLHLYWVYTHSPARWLVRSVICSRSQHIICTIMYDVVEHSLLQTKHTQMHTKVQKEKNETHLLYSFTCSIVTQEFIQRLHIFFATNIRTQYICMYYNCYSLSAWLCFTALLKMQLPNTNLPASVFAPPPLLRSTFSMCDYENGFMPACAILSPIFHFIFFGLFLVKVSFGTCHWKG